MAFTDDRPPKWGCLIGPLLMSPFAFLWFLAGAMGGGGCEGDPNPNCVGDYTPMWIGLTVIGLAVIIIALGVNRLLKWWFDRSH
jgi:hypothetical protein